MGGINSQFKIGGVPHILWLVLPLAVVAILCGVFSKHKKAGRITIYVLAVVLLVLRVVKYGFLKPLLWNETWKTIVPFELCTILTFVLPFTVFFKTAKFNAFVYPLAIFGGIVTLAYPEWIYNGYGLNFNKLESLIAHTALFAIPFFSQASQFNFKLQIRDYYKPVLAMLVLILYAYIANRFITPGTNHMFIKQNPLPINIPGMHHMVLFAAAFLLYLFLLCLPNLIKVTRAKRRNKRNK